MKRNPAPKPASADATMEYRGPIDEVVTDVSVELVGEPTRGDVHPMVAAAIERAKSLTPVAMTAPRPSGPPPRRKLNPDASLEFPHPLNPALYGDDSGGHVGLHGVRGEHYGPEAFEGMDDELPPPRREVPRWRFVAVAGVMTLAAVIIGLALGSHAHVTIASASESDTPREVVKVPAKKAPATETAATPEKKADSTAAPAASPTPPPAPTTGHVTSPKWAKDRHTFMDGKEVGRSGDLEVACGTHVIQIGLKGKARKVQIPCGGSVVVLP